MSKRLDERIARFKKAPERSLLTISLPMMMSVVVILLYNLTDTAFVGRLGVDALAAVTFSFPLFFIGMALANLVGLGAMTFISQRLGARAYGQAGDIATHALQLSFLFALLFTLGGLLFLEPMLALLGAEPAVLDLAKQYMLPIIAGSLLLFLAGSFNAILMAEGNTKTPALIKVVSALLNVALDALFIFGLGWGVLGASLATMLAILFEVVAYLYLFFHKRHSNLHLFRHGWRIRWEHTRRILLLGLPLSGAQLMMSFSFLFFNGLFATFGTATVAAYGLVGRIDSLMFMPMMGLSIGLVTLVGIFYGAKEYALLTRVMKAAIIYSLVYAVLLGTLLWLFPAQVLRLLTNDASVIALAIPLLRLEVFAYPLMAAGFLMARTLQGLGDGLPSLVVTGARLLLVAVPLAWWFTSLGYGPRSIILAMLIAGVVSVIIAAVWVRVKLGRFMTAA